MERTPKVFISYSHQSMDYENKVLDFSNKLRAEGIDATVDLYEESPAEGWPRWIENQIHTADFVLVLCSKSYYEKCYSDLYKGKGISWEVNIVYQLVYDNASINKKYIPIYFDEEDVNYILTPLKSFSYYNVGTKEGFDKLYWRLRGVIKVNKPPLGKLRPLPEKERRTMFFTTPIDLNKWNSAGWKGMLYLFSPGRIPVLGCIYRNYEIAQKIFIEWKKQSNNDYLDKFIKIDYIVPPFPKGLWLHSDKERNSGKGYFVHIGPNIDASISRAIDSGMKLEELIIAAISRYIWVDEINGSQNREAFEHYIDNGSGYLMMPIGIKDENKRIEESNLIIDFNYTIKMKHAEFKTGISLTKDDICRIVLEPSK